MWQCPGCGARAATTVHRIDVAMAATHHIRAWVDQRGHNDLRGHIASLWGGETARVARCAGCGLRSSDPFVAGDAAFYRLAYGRASARPYPGDRWEFGLATDAARQARGSILEIGAGDGAFLRQLIDAGISPDRLFATEFSTEGLAALGQLGVSATDADFRDLPAADHDLVCAHQVFEHLGDIDAAFAAFDRLLSNDGAVALSVPNGLNTAAAEVRGSLLDMPPNHVTTWTPAALASAAARRGWRVSDLHVRPFDRRRAAVALARGRAHASRRQPRSVGAVIEARARTATARYWLTAVHAAAHLPAAYLNPTGHGDVIWGLLRRGAIVPTRRTDVTSGLLDNP